MKQKCYVLMLAKQFPVGHRRKGQATFFKQQYQMRDKIHTIRNNYELWKKRIEEVQAGTAYISLRQWIEKPYNSDQTEIGRLHNDDQIGIQSYAHGDFPLVDGSLTPQKIIARNDGLSQEDFKSWFSKAKPEQMALIHFTKFRY